MSDSKGMTRLAEAVRARRAELGLTHDSVLAAGGPSGVTLTKIESASGPVPRPSTLKKLDKALDWAPGSSARVIAGSVPTPLSFASEDDRVRFIADTIAKAGLAHQRAQAAYLEMGMIAANFIEHPVPPELRELYASEMRIATNNLAVQFLVHLDPRDDVDDLSRRVSKLLTPENLMTAEDMREKFRRSADFIERARVSEPDAGSLKTGDVTSLASRREVPPPPNIDELDVAASRREKQSDRDPSLGRWVSPDDATNPRATPPFVPDAIRAVLPKAVFQDYAAAVRGVQKHLSAVQEAAAERRLTTETVISLLDAIDGYADAARTFTAELRRVELDATREQFDSALPIFAQGWAFADSLSTFIGHLLSAAPNTTESGRIISAQQSLGELAAFHRYAYDTWVETGRSSEPLKAAASRRERQSGWSSNDDEHE